MRKLLTLCAVVFFTAGVWAGDVVTGMSTIFDSYTARYVRSGVPSPSTDIVDAVYFANNGSISMVSNNNGVKLSNGAVVFYLKQAANVMFTFIGGSSNVAANLVGYDFIISNTTTTDGSTPEVYRAYTLMAGQSKTSADWLNTNGNVLCADGTTSFYTFFSTNIGMTVKSGAIKSESKVYNLFSSMSGDYAATCFSANTDYDGSVTGVNSGAEKSFDIDLPAGYYAFNLTTSNTIGLKSIEFTASTPVLTGAWRISSDTVTSANVMQGGSATLPTFSVGATSGTPTGGDYNVAYSLKAGSTEGIFTFTDGIPTAISTENSGTATLIATLTTTNAENYLTPVTNTFEYTVTVAAAAAPSFTSITPSATNLVRGTASDIVAVVAGTPTPTIQWYSCDDTEKSNPVAIDGATALTLDLENTTVGTYYYYAVATNTTAQVNNVASAVQTITVAPKAPTMPASGIFIDSKSVTISKADGEAAEAVIKYSTDDGVNWSTYSDALELDATTTIKAKVEQAGLTSTITEATYTKVVLDEQVDVTGSTTWDWNDVTNGSAVDLGSTELNNEDVLYSNISKYGYTAVSGLASQQALLMNGQRAYNNANGSKHCQVNYLKFNTTVAGKVTVEYANTGGNAARTVNINGTKGSKTVTTNTDYVSETMDVSAGAITIKGVQVSDDADKMLRIRKVVFTQTYAVNCAATTNGSLSADKALAAAGETVTLTVTPDAKYAVASVKYNDGEEHAIEKVNDTYSFVMPAAAVTVSATFSSTVGVDNTVDEAKAVKFIENGQVVIFKDGKYFNVLGIQIR